MIVLKITQELINELSLSEKELFTGRSKNSMNIWYILISRINRRKCLLVTHKNSLYSFLIYGVHKNNLLNLSKFLKANLLINLKYENINYSFINQLGSKFEKIKISRIKRKKDIYLLNDILKKFESHLPNDDFVTRHLILEVNKKINDFPYETLEGKHPINILKDKLLNDYIIDYN